MKTANVIILVVLVAVALIIGGKYMAKDETIEENNNADVVVEENNDANVVAEDIVNPKVLFTTNKGSFTLEIFQKESPITAGNFLKLVGEGFYDGTKFHRVIAGFMNQGGDPLTKDDAMQGSWGTGGPGYAIEDEFIEGLSNAPGTISMANSGPNSGGSQFFLNVGNNVNLDWDKGDERSKHPVFGKVIEGMDVVTAINGVPTSGSPLDRPLDPVIIEKVELVQ